MKKTFSLTAPGTDDARVRDRIRHGVNKYIRRERKKKLPDGFDVWTFHCKAGPSAVAAETRALKEIGGTIDAVAAAGATEIYIEIIAAPGRRTFSG